MSNNFWEEDSKEYEPKKKEDSFWEDDAFEPVKYLKTIDKKVPETKEKELLPGFLPQFPIVSPLIRKGVSAISGLTGKGEFGKEYSEAEKGLKESEAESRAKYPKMTAATEFLGGMALPFPGSTATTTMGKLGQLGLRSLTGAGYAGAEAALQDKNLLGIAEQMKSGLENHLIWGEAAPQLAKSFGKYVYAPVVAGIKPKTSEKYFKRNAEIKKENLPDLKKDIDETVSNLREDYLDTKQLAKEASNEYKIQNRRAYLDLKSKAKPSEGLAEGILDSMANLRNQISNQSSKAFDVLQKTGKTASIRNIKNHVANELNGLKIAGVESQSEAVPVLRKQYEWLSKIPEDRVSFTDLKRYVQDLDEQIAGSYAKLKTPGGYLTQGDRALINLRGWIDQFYLKKIPEYAAIMEPLSKHTQLSKYMQDMIGNERDAFRVLRNIHKPEFKRERALIEGLGMVTGKNFKKPISEYENNIALLGNKEYFNDLMRKSKEYESTKMAQDVAEVAKQRYEPIKQITPRTSENLIRRGFTKEDGLEKNLQSQEDLKYLSDFGLQDYPRRVENLGIKEVFEKPYIHGSRNVNLFGLSGRGLGNILEGSKGDILATIAPFYGALNDTFGRKAVKGIIDLSAHPKYGKMLAESARRGFNSLALTISILGKNDPEFRAALEQP